MSKAKTAAKVLRVAINRAQKGQWVKGAFRRHDRNNPDNGVGYCNIGLLTAGNDCPLTNAQREAMGLCAQIIRERFPDRINLWDRTGDGDYGVDKSTIVHFNDHENTTLEELLEVLKLALIRCETGGLDDPEEIDPDEIADLFPTLGNKDLVELMD